MLLMFMSPVMVWLICLPYALIKINLLCRYMLSADTKADKVTWLNTINESLKDWRAWHHNAAQKVKQRSQSIESDVIML